MENIYVLALAVNLIRFRPHVPTSLPWADGSMSVQFSKILQYYSDLSGVCVTKWSVWNLDGCLLSQFFGMLIGI